MVTDKMKALEIDLDINPLSKTEFSFLDTDVKVSKKRVYLCLSLGVTRKKIDIYL